MTNPTEGAILQRDGRTWAVTTRIPAGIVTPEQLETIARSWAEVSCAHSEDYLGPADFVLAGLEPDDVSAGHR